MNEKQRQKPSVIYWINLWQVLFPFLRNKGYELQPNQCHVTVSDLSSEWHWHGATVRSFGCNGRVRLVESHPAFQKRHHYHDCANQPIHGVLQWTEEVEPCRTAT